MIQMHLCSNQVLSTILYYIRLSNIMSTQEDVPIRIKKSLEGYKVFKYCLISITRRRRKTIRSSEYIVSNKLYFKMRCLQNHLEIGKVLFSQNGFGFQGLTQKEDCCYKLLSKRAIVQGYISEKIISVYKPFFCCSRIVLLSRA